MLLAAVMDAKRARGVGREAFSKNVRNEEMQTQKGYSMGGVDEMVRLWVCSAPTLLDMTDLLFGFCTVQTLG